MATLPLATKGLLVVAVPVGALLVAMVVFYQFESRLRQAQAEVTRTFEARGALRQLLIEMVNAETGARGYLLSRNPEFLGSYRSAQQALPQLFAELRRELSPEQAPQLPAIEALARRVMQALEDSREDVVAKPAEAMQHLQSDKSAMDELRSRLEAMQTGEQAALAHRIAVAEVAGQRLRSAVFAGGAFGLLGGLLAALLFSASIGSRLRHLEAEARAVAAGRTITHRISGHDELSRLEQTLKDASEQLARQSEELRTAQAELELRVHERTAELAAANEELRQSNEVREALVQSSPLAIWAVDLDGTVSFWNPAAEQIFGWKAEEVVGKPLPVVPSEQREEYAGWLDGFRRGEMIKGVERERVCRDSRRINVVIWTAPLRDRTGHIRGTIAIDSDISQRKLLEEQFRQAQKLEAVGRLAGGVAHDFNNLLTIIQGYTEMVLMESEQQPNLIEYAQEIQYATERASALTGQLLAFSRRQVSQPQTLDLNETVTHSMKMLRRIIGEDVEIAARLAPDLGKVRIDPVHIDQVIMNLAVNARDAMPTGGRLTIETGNVELDEEYAERHIGVSPGMYCMLAVSDTGTGMTPETRSRIFEPFFTTKEPGKGTGLGLAIVYGIVKQAGGDILVYSEPGAGTSFKIYLPAIGAPAEKTQSRRTREMKGSETILVCEDDPKIRRLVQAMLTRQGYHVLAAEHPNQALETARRFDGPIDLLLTDIVMPRVSGFELAKTVTEIRPHLRVLYMSGYTDNQVSGSWVLDENMPFIQKPFTAAALAAKVREALGNEAPETEPRP